MTVLVPYGYFLGHHIAATPASCTVIIDVAIRVFITAVI